MPTPHTSIGPSSAPAYPDSGSSRANQTSPPLMAAPPTPVSTRGPKRGRNFAATPETTTISEASGTKARPAASGV